VARSAGEPSDSGGRACAERGDARDLNRERDVRLNDVVRGTSNALLRLIKSVIRPSTDLG